jgi:Rrf2 family protein
MKISATEEYGLRILLRIASAGEEGMNIPQLSAAEGLSEPYTGKLTRLLRISGLIRSTRGQKGGYVLAQPPGKIRISDVLHALDGSMFDDAFCTTHTGIQRFCTHSVDCSVKSLWKTLQNSIDQVLQNITLGDMIRNFNEAALFMPQDKAMHTGTGSL